MIQDRVQSLLSYIETSPPIAVISGRGVGTSARIMATNLVSPLERRKVRRLTRQTPLRLQLGGGRNNKDGWINLDLVGRSADLAWSVTKPLPFRDDSVDAIFHEALARYITLRQCLELTRECRRVLKPGGVLRVGIADALAYSRSYATDPTGLLETLRPDRPTPLLALQEMWYMADARTAFDYDTFALMVQAAGFEAPESHEFGDSRLTPCPDTPNHRLAMFYLEVVKE